MDSDRPIFIHSIFQNPVKLPPPPSASIEAAPPAPSVVAAQHPNVQRMLATSQVTRTNPILANRLAALAPGAINNTPPTLGAANTAPALGPINNMPPTLGAMNNTNNHNYNPGTPNSASFDSSGTSTPENLAENAEKKLAITKFGAENCHLEICNPAQVARNLLPDSAPHEAKIVKVVNSSSNGQRPMENEIQRHMENEKRMPMTNERPVVNERPMVNEIQRPINGCAENSLDGLDLKVVIPKFIPPINGVLRAGTQMQNGPTTGNPGTPSGNNGNLEMPSGSIRNCGNPGTPSPDFNKMQANVEQAHASICQMLDNPPQATPPIPNAAKPNAEPSALDSISSVISAVAAQAAMENGTGSGK